MDQRLNESVMAATKEMFSSMLGWDVECKPPIERPVNTTTAETSAIISFVGSPSGAFALKCTLGFASKIASQMLGMDVSVESDDLKDAVGEFLNMVVGRAKTIYSTDEVFKISVPTLVVGEDYALHIKANNGDTVSALEFRFENDGMSIEIVLN
jgi:CheY-specific phosphatase CheX